jgi:hypothetical protein
MLLPPTNSRSRYSFFVELAKRFAHGPICGTVGGACPIVDEGTKLGVADIAKRKLRREVSSLSTEIGRETLDPRQMYSTPKLRGSGAR